MSGMTHGAQTHPREGIVLAVILITVGVGALMLQLYPDAGDLILALIGIALLAVFAFTRAYGALIPGAIMTGLGLGIVAAQNLSVTDEASGGVIVLGLGLGFIGIWVLSGLARLEEHHPWPLVPGGILVAVAIGLLIGGVALDVMQYWPVVLIALGLIVLWRAWTEMRSRP